MKFALMISICALLGSCAPHDTPTESDLGKQLEQETLPESSKQNSRQTGTKRLAQKGGGRQASAITDGLDWLSKHQSAEGRWRSDSFSANCPEDDACTGKGLASNDIGVTGLVLLAMLGNGNTQKVGPYKDEVQKAAVWLFDQQDKEGLIGQAGSLTTMYNHAIATTALAELAGLSGSKVLRPQVQKAIDYILKARNPYKVWRYHPRDGQNDSSVTGWMVMALTSAKTWGFKVDKKALDYSLAWFDEVTDPSTGQVGYRKVGEGSSRPKELGKSFPASETEALTAIGLCCRIFAGQTPDKEPILRVAADRLLQKVPAWTNDGRIDLFYWYYGTLACFQMGRKWWDGWKKGMARSLSDNQVSKGHAKGSWNPDGVWGSSGGRVATTALAVMCLQVYYRYTTLIR